MKNGKEIADKLRTVINLNYDFEAIAGWLCEKFDIDPSEELEEVSRLLVKVDGESSDSPEFNEAYYRFLKILKEGK